MPTLMMYESDCISLMFADELLFCWSVAKSYVFQAFNCTSLGVGSEDFQPFDSFTSDDIFPYLADVNQSFSEIDFREFKEMINETEFLSFDLTELEGNLTVIAVSSSTTDIWI